MRIGMTVEIVLIMEPGMDMVMEPVITQTLILSAQRLISPAMQTGTAIGIGLRTTIDTVMQIAGWDTEVTGGWGREDAGNNRIQGAV